MANSDKPSVRQSVRANFGVPPVRYDGSNIEYGSQQLHDLNPEAEPFGTVHENNFCDSVQTAAKGLCPSENDVHENGSHESQKVSSNKASSRSSRKCREEALRAELETKRRLAALNDEIDRRRLEREKEIMLAELELKKAEIEGESSENYSELFGDNTSRVSEAQRQKANSIQLWVNSSEPERFQGEVNNSDHDIEQRDPSARDQQSNVRDSDLLKELVATFKKLNTSLEVRGERRQDDTRGEARQLMARQCMGKDLPYFDGQPEEWQNFIMQFEESTNACGFSEQENMCRIRQSLRGKARELVQSMLSGADNLQIVLTSLEQKYGRPELVIRSLIAKTRELRNPREEKPETIVDFAIAVRNMVTAMSGLEAGHHIANPQLLEELTDKLSSSLKMRWLMFREDTEIITPSLVDFSKWLDKLARAAGLASTPVFRSEQKGTEVKGSELKKPTYQKKINYQKDVLFSTGEEEISKSLKCRFCDDNHKIKSCLTFKNLSVEKRREWVIEAKACFLCLGTGHRAAKCRSAFKSCGQSGCKGRHHRLLHQDKSIPEENKETEYQAEQVGYVGNAVLLRVAPVVIKGAKVEKKIFALFDEGSTTTLLDADVAREIGVKGRRDPLQLAWTNGSTQEDRNSQRVELEIRGITSEETFALKNVRTVKDLNLRTQSVDMKKFTEKWKHLQDVDAMSLRNVRPCLLIGQDNIDLILPREIREGPKNAPVATRTKLGWLVHGNVDAGRDRFSGEVLCHTYERENEDLYRLVKESFALDNMGVQNVVHRPRAEEDIRAQILMDKTTKRDGERWETGLLWKSEEMKLPSSESMAKKRLQSIECRMDREPQFGQLYCEKINEYLNKGYAKILSEEEAKVESDKTWYLPHFGVWNANKPEKMRLVFDAAAKTSCTSLNDNLLTGPDLYNSLVDILCKFRQFKIAICADIKEMFHQIRIKEEDLCAQRFLFRGLDRSRDPDTLQMNVMIFGASCSPASAQNVKNRNAKEWDVEFPRAAEAIVHRHYMDDYLDSVETAVEAITLVRDVTEVHRRGGFTICNWLSNEKTILHSVPEALRAASNKDFNMNSEVSVERVLGLFWSPASDGFYFRTAFHKVNPQILLGNRTPTKRDILRIVMSIFDPLGLLGHFVVKAKILNQDVWRMGLGWDDELSGEVLLKWERWLAELPRLEAVCVPRWYGTEKATEIELHILCDASEKAYAAVAYLRFKTHGKWETALVMSRTKVSPLKPCSIPRLELQAALLATRMMQTIIAGHSLHMKSTHFWTDSKTVLCWLRTTDPRRFLPFVANRVGEILEYTDVARWHWIPTRENVADEATRDCRECSLEPSTRWFKGPDFLREDIDKWPQERYSQDQSHCSPSEEERTTVYVIVDQPFEGYPSISHFSSYLRLTRVAAWVLRFVNNIKYPCAKKGGALSPDEVTAAERRWWRWVQEVCYRDELRCLLSGSSVSTKSRLIQHGPKLDKHGIMRRVGRLSQKMDAQNLESFPVILERKHPLTKLLLQRYHEQAGHHGQETVVNEVQQRFWMPSLRVAVKGTWNSCQKCKNARANPSTPEMGSLPPCRIQRPERPFSIVGLDYFGPLEVKIGRRIEKRYGALFTCMACRAVHLELTSSLSTDSAIMAIRRFASRRGNPLEIWSDNGTNFRGADVELRNALQDFDQDKIQEEMTTKGIKWTFIPPSAPHMGGAWERLVRSVKTALKAILQEQRPSEEVLRTLFSEAEAAVNSRPLTHVPVDPDDPEAITPFHFLLGTSSILQLPGAFTQGDLWGRKQWRIAQSLAEQFWKRWLREYVPSLGRAGKWHHRTENLKEDDIVLVIDQTNSRGKWPMGRIVRTYPSRQDGRVRVVDVKTVTGIYKRPVVKLCKLITKTSANSLEESDLAGGKDVTATA